MRDIVDSLGGVIAHLNINPYGVVITETGPGGDRYAWTGRERDVEIHLYFFRARYVDGDLAQFSSNDRIGMRAGDPNFRRYVGNNATNATDPSGLDYRDDFVEETPDMPKDWKVHHTKRQALRDRYLNEAKINVDETTHLRAVPKEVHDEITMMQQKWDVQKMRELGILKEGEALTDANKAKSYERLWKEVKLSDADAFNVELDKVYSKYWIKTGKNQEAAVKRISKSTSGQQLKLFSTGRESRLKKLLPKLAGAVVLLAMVGDNLVFGYNILNHDEAQLAAWKNFEGNYALALKEVETNSKLSKERAHFVRQSFIEYLQALKAPEREVNLINMAMTIYIDTELP